MKQCLKCSKEFKTKQELDRHLNRKIKCDNKIECNDCKREFKTKQKLERHLNRKISCLLEAEKYRTEVLELKNQNLILKNENLELKMAAIINNTTNNIIINNTNNGIINNTINIFGNEDLKHITKQILKDEILKIAEADYDEYKGKLMEIKGQRYNSAYIKDMELHYLLNNLIYFQKKNNITIKKEDGKFYINTKEGWMDIEQEDLHIRTLTKQQEVLARHKEPITENKIYKRTIEKYFTDGECNVIIEATGVKDKMINKKPRNQILIKLLDYELENIATANINKKKLKIEHNLNLIK